MAIGYVFFFFQADDGIRDLTVTGVQTCALPIAESPTPYAGPIAGGILGACASPSFAPAARKTSATETGAGRSCAASKGESRWVSPPLPARPKTMALRIPLPCISHCQYRSA